MHSSCLWDTETTRFNCVVQSDPYSHTWQQQYCSISQRWYFTTCRMHWQHEDRLMYFQSRKHRGHSYMCPPGLTQPKEGPSKHSLEICTWSYSPALLQLHWCAPLPGPRSRMFGCNTSGWCSGIPPLVAAKYGRERSAFRPHPIGYFSNLCKPKWL